MTYSNKFLSSYHFIGIGGIGMSGLARILLIKKTKVSGSDLSLNYVAKELLELGAEIKIGHSSTNIDEDMTVVYSTDIPKDNPEFIEAKRLGCRLIHRSDLLHELTHPYSTLAIAGTHGKTTTTSLLISVLQSAELDPSYAVGGILTANRSNAAIGAGEFFVIEADESDGSFVKYSPHGAIITNIDGDHLNHYGSFEALVDAFKIFIEKVNCPELLFWCGDDPHLSKIHPKGNSYGFSEQCQWKISSFEQNDWQIVFDLTHQGKCYQKIEVSLAGSHNALNASAVFAMAIQLKIPEEKVRKGLKSFKGVGRRCEKKAEISHRLILDDYAHHPTEIKATLSAIRAAIPSKRLLAVFQPHRYSRLQHCMGAFGDVFENADHVIVTDIYSAGEKPIEGVTNENIISEILQSGKSCQYIPRIELAEKVFQQSLEGDVIVSLGAGDVTKLAAEIAIIPNVSKNWIWADAKAPAIVLS